MNNLKIELRNRIETLFSEVSIELHNEAYKLVSSVNRNYSNDPLENLKEKLNEGESRLTVAGKGLVVFCNKKIADFEEEISEVKEPHKTEAVNKYRDLLMSESRRLIQKLFNERVL